MSSNDVQEFLSVLKTFDTAMLVTRRDNTLRSRPMAIADRTESGRVWFVTSIDSGKVDEMTENPGVNVVMQANGRFLSISGTIRATRDSARIDELWNESQAIWFSEGRDDPELVLLEVVPTFAEYWNRSGVEGVKFMFAAVRSAVTGTALGDDQGKHGKVEFSEGRSTRE